MLRWLSDKLKKEPNARSSPEAWSTLHRILRDLPPAVISKAIPGADLLPTIATTLAELFPTTSRSSTHVLPTNAGEVVPGKSAKKRKRTASDKEEVLSQSGIPQPSPDRADRGAIFLSIAALLRLLLDSAEHSHAKLYAPVHNQIRSALRLANSAFASFLSNWLTALLYFTPRDGQPILPTQANILSFGLHLVTDLLAMQSTSQHSSPADSFDALFSRLCAIPAALLLSTLNTTSTTAEQSSLVSPSLQVLERLLAQQVFVPARTAFNAHSNHHATLTVKSASRHHHASLSERLEPFRDDIANLAAKSASDGLEKATAHNALPHLLDVALRCTPTSTPRQRIAEAPWIDTLFTALCASLPRQAPGSVHQSSTANDTLVAMLDVMLRRKLSLTRQLLVDLVHDWSRLLLPAEQSSPSTGQPDFHLLAKALAMDPNLFTDVKSPRTQALFEALTAHGSVARLSDVLRDDKDYNARVQVQELLCTHIAVPLMKAFARNRNLKAFVDLWLKQLQGKPARDNYEWYIWTDPSLQTSLRLVLETSLNLDQITDLLESCRISSLDLTSQQSSQAAASAVVLNAVIGAVHNDSTIDALQETLRALVDTIQDAIKSAGKTPLTATLLALLSRSYLLWFPIWSTTHSQQETEAQLDALLESPAVQHSLKSIERLGEEHLTVADAAFAFIATMCDLLRRFPSRHDAIKSLICKVAMLPDGKKRASVPAGFATSRPVAFYTSLVEFPYLLEYLPQVTRQAIFQNSLHFASQDTAANRIVVEAFVESAISAANHSVRDDLFSALSHHIGSHSSSQAERKVARDLLLLWSSKGLARQQREKILDLAIDTMIKPGDVAKDVQPQLGLIANLLDQPNATAKIATDSSIVSQVASVLSAEDAEDLTLDLFEEICNLLFKHIVDTKEQERSEAFISSLSKSLAAFIETRQPLQSTTGTIRLLAAFLKATEARLDNMTLSKLPHRLSTAIDSLVKHLYQTLSANLEDEDLSQGSRLSGISSAVRVYVNLPAPFQASGGSTSSKYAKRFTKQLNSLLSSPSNLLTIPIRVQVQCFERLAPAMIEENALQLFAIAEALLTRDLDAKQHYAITHSTAESARTIPDTKKLSLIDQLLSSSQLTAEKGGLVRCLIVSLQSSKDGDSSATVLTSLLDLLRNCAVYETHCELVGCVTTILRDKVRYIKTLSIRLN